jgi:hypothetical protein
MTQGWYATATFGILSVSSISAFLRSFSYSFAVWCKNRYGLGSFPQEELMKTMIIIREMAVGSVGTEYESHYACYRQSVGCVVSIFCGRI